MANYLQKFVQQTEDLPKELQRKFVLISELDERARKQSTEGKDSAKMGILEANHARKLHQGGTIDAATLQKLQLSWKQRFSDAEEGFVSALRLAEEKQRVALQAYDLVDNHINLLDQALTALGEDITQDRLALGLPPLAQLGRPVPLAGAATAPALAGEDAAALGAGGYPKRSSRKRKAVDGMLSAAEVGLGMGGGELGAGAATAAAVPAVAGGLLVNEPLYCMCQQTQYGEMIGCDNPDCPIEWFHVQCVGIDPNNKPKGEWFCPQCVQLQKSRRLKQA